MQSEGFGCLPLTAGTRGEDAEECTASERNLNASEAIATLIVRLTAPAQGGPVSLGGRVAERMLAFPSTLQRSAGRDRAHCRA